MDFAEHIEHKMYEQMVGRAMFCPLTGKVLDIRTAVVVEAPDGGKTYGILSPEGWAQIKDGLLSKYPELRVVIDGKVQTNEKEN